jgi:hypothetical protein
MNGHHQTGPTGPFRAMSGRPNSGHALYLCIPLSSLLMPCASARTIERRREIFILAGAMKRMLILTVTLWLGVSATAHAQVNSPTNATSTVTGAIVPSCEGVVTGGGFSPSVPVPLPCPFGISLSAVPTPPTSATSTVTGAIVPSGQGVATGGGSSPFVPVPMPCPFGVSLSAILTPFFGCASDPLSAPTYQISAGPAVVITGPVGSISANAQTVTPNATSGAGGAGGGVSSSAGCLGAMPSTSGSVGAGNFFGGIGGC